ncbi:flavohemoglobin expression-modulating QEGLA motif protein [Zobellia laminariae]|uniref:tyrosine/phenylalanine carboxypeptidase domain-containing protein n=1 Tax=Zobellia laminariae TaxID=248906 RepID=UPI0012D8594A|nr:DUF1704 domain-containing protein [Zobellia laminariae]
MQHYKDLSKETVDRILVDLRKDEDEYNFKLPNGGFLHIESGLPYLTIYRMANKDSGTKELLLNEASYLIIGRGNFNTYQYLLFEIANYFSAQYKSYLLFEIYAGKPNSTCFRIKGPADLLPKTLKVLDKGLKEVNTISPGVAIASKIEDTADRHPEGSCHLLTIEETKQCGALLVGLEIPPVYRSERRKLFPVFFRNFHSSVTTAMKKAIFSFIRIQTACGISSYNLLGQRSLKEKVFEIDKKLTEIERTYQFLWLVSPSNIYNIKETFFESRFKTVLDYHYRLLPIDPDVLKRKLYDLKIEKIEDPVLSHIFRQKREELDRQITMLNVRGTANFFYNSIRLHQGIGRKLLSEAENILTQLTEKQGDTKNLNLMDANEFAALVKDEIDFLKKQHPGFSCEVYIREDVNIMMVSNGNLYLPADYTVGPKEAEALIQHEIGTHALTYFNGKEQPFEQFSMGLADYDPLQEGLAVLSEYLVGGLTRNRLRTLAGRVVAGQARLDGHDFRAIFDLLLTKFNFTEKRSFNIVSRTMQGGGFLKDIIYLKGFLKLIEYLKGGGSLEPLLSGKFGFHHIKIVQQLTERNILKPPILRPSYLSNTEFENKIKKIKEGLPIVEMVCDGNLEQSLKMN